MGEGEKKIPSCGMKQKRGRGLDPAGHVKKTNPKKTIWKKKKKKNISNPPSCPNGEGGSQKKKKPGSRPKRGLSRPQRRKKKDSARGVEFPSTTGKKGGCLEDPRISGENQNQTLGKKAPW